MKTLLTLCFFILSLFSISAEILMIDTVTAIPASEWGDIQRQSIRSMQNGIIDQCFENGYMVFDSSSTLGQIDLDPELALQEARRVGADILIRIQALPEEKKMLYLIYSVTGEVVLSSGKWDAEDSLSESSEDLADWFYQCGMDTFGLISSL